MFTKKSLLFITGGIIMTTILSGCTSKKKEEIEQSFDQVLALYPTKNLMDFYEMEGYRDEEFDEGDKGVWSLHSAMSISSEENTKLISEGMVLRMNRNTRTAKGFYYQRNVSSYSKETTENRYPIKFDVQGFHLTDEINDEKLRERIENFQFFVQYGDFSQLDNYENIRKMYNPNVPIYELEYQLTNDDHNVQQLRKLYDIPTDNAPTLLLKGRGNLEGTSVGYKSLEFTFDKEVDVFFTDSIDFQPAIEEDYQ